MPASRHDALVVCRRITIHSAWSYFQFLDTQCATRKLLLLPVTTALVRLAHHFSECVFFLALGD